MFARLLAHLGLGDDDNSSTGKTSAAYEEAARAYLPGVLIRHCGLNVIPFVPVHRLQFEIGATAGVESLEWNFRAPVRVKSTPPSAPTKNQTFIIYPAQDSYLRPDARVPRAISPLKSRGETVKCDYLAIFEVTTGPQWAKSLLLRLEERLYVTLERYKVVALERGDVHITDVVAVVGVVSPFSCQRSVAHNMAGGRFPLLHAMQEHARFVFVHLPCEGSEADVATVAGRSAEDAPMGGLQHFHAPHTARELSTPPSVGMLPAPCHTARVLTLRRRFRRECCSRIQ